MIIKPISRGFICTTAHPEGCARNVREQIEYVRRHPLAKGPARALVIGASTGYGLAARVAAAFGWGAKTLGVFFERPAEDKRTATAGWYNTAAFENEALARGLWARSLNGDAFSDELKAKAVEIIRREWGEVDAVVYSLASPRRAHPRTGELFTSLIKPIERPFRSKTVHFQSGQVSEILLEPAGEQDIRHTVAVMGGEDWRFWMETLDQAGVLAEGATTVAFSYIGPRATAAIYRQGTIGRAKDDLEATARLLDERLQKRGGRAFVSVNKALVTQASAAIPVVPLYIALLYRVMKDKNVHEGCIEQIHRLYRDHLFQKDPGADAMGRLRIDDLEMREDVQDEVARRWARVDTDSLPTLGDLEGYQKEFFKLFGFGVPGVDYATDTAADVPIPSLTAGTVSA
jgi:enoyl-[acyl-carrier protein] reductase/trans-2-enoyl-CoA reductase (NAD+)